MKKTTEWRLSAWALSQNSKSLLTIRLNRTFGYDHSNPSPRFCNTRRLFENPDDINLVKIQGQHQSGPYSATLFIPGQNAFPHINLDMWMIRGDTHFLTYQTGTPSLRALPGKCVSARYSAWHCHPRDIAVSATKSKNYPGTTGLSGYTP